MPGIGLNVSISNRRKSGIPRPFAQPATSATGTGFTANFLTDSGTTAGVVIDVANDALFTDIITTFNNKNIGNITSYIVAGLGGLQTYYWRIREILNSIVQPDTNYTYASTVNVVYTDGVSDIATAITAANALHPSITNRIKIYIPDGTYNLIDTNTLPTHGLTFFGQSKSGVIINIATSGKSAFQIGSFTSYFENLTMTGTNTGTLVVHSDGGDGTPSDVILRNLSISGFGSTIWPVGAGVGYGSRFIMMDCEVYSQSNVGMDFHNRSLSDNSGNKASAQVQLFNTTITLGSANNAFVYDNFGSQNSTDLLYAENCTFNNFVQGNSGAGADETYYSFVNCNIGSFSFTDASKNLNAAQLKTFLTTNSVSQNYSNYSNVETATTLSEGTAPLDNQKTNSIAWASSVGFQLRTAYTGPFTNTTTNLAAITTFYDQSANAKNTTEPTNSPIYETDGMGVGIASLLSITGVAPSQLSLAAALNLGTNYDIIFCIKRIGTSFAVFNGENKPQQYANSQFFCYGHGSSPSHFDATINTTTNHVINLRRRGNTLELLVDGVSIAINTLSGPALFSWQYLLNDLDTDNSAIHFGEGACIINSSSAFVNTYVATVRSRFSTP